MPRFIIDPGELHCLLVLETPVDMPDGAGGAARGWLGVATLWASVVPEAMAPVTDAARPGGLLRYRVTVRRHAQVTAACRFRDGTRILHIDAAADPDGRRRWLVCRCRQVQP